MSTFPNDMDESDFGQMDEEEESIHGPDCLQRSVEDHEIEMGRACKVNDEQV